MGRRVIGAAVVILCLAACGDSAPFEPAPADLAPVTQEDAALLTDAGADDLLSSDAAQQQGVELNPGWIGGACVTAADCTNPGAMCMTNGFGGGMCTQPCSTSSGGMMICPDADTSAQTLNTTSRCIETPSMPACVSGCDFDKSPTGCRTGYTCVMRQRAGNPAVVFPVCLPSTTQTWPGETAPANDIGKACGSAADCANLSCLSLSGGYCTKSYCDIAGCPADSTCFGLNNGEVHVCLKTCTASSQCRQSEGYTCDSDSTCWAGPAAAPPWDSSVGAADCATAWANGLHVCDSTPDSYVVVHKSKRNLALCEAGSLVENFNVGLGFSPTATKTKAGDGKTPEGVYYIPRLVPMSTYYMAFLISYPSPSDATAGFAAGTITSAEKDAIIAANASCGEPSQQTGMGGLVEIHGNGAGQDWTNGCVALDDGAIDQLWMTLGVRDTIVILP